MKLEFDNLQELEQFLMFAAHIGGQLSADRAVADAVDDRAVAVDDRVADDQAVADAVAVDDQAVADAVAARRAADASRKRRSRAAARAHALDVPVDRDRPGRVAELPTDSEREQVSAVSETDAHANGDMSAGQFNGPVEADEAGPSALDHLRACKLFIQKHGKAAFDRTFDDMLPPDVIHYTAEQRTLHIVRLGVDI